MLIYPMIHRTTVAARRCYRQLQDSTEFQHTHYLLSEKRLDTSFSEVKYKNIAPFVGLRPGKFFDDAGTFDLHRSRIPTRLFENIVMDMDMLLAQYGPPSQMSHTTEEAKSRLLAPIFNHLVAQFDSFFRNTPESLIAGHVTRKDRIQHIFSSFGLFTVVFVEAKLKIKNDNATLRAIAQVIAECDACDKNNKNFGFNMPIYGILCDGISFQFFRFDGNTKPCTFLKGIVPGHDRGVETTGLAGLHLRFLLEPTALPFIQSLRPVCETLFNIFLATFVASLKARCDYASTLKRHQESLEACQWDNALKLAEEALEKSECAEVLRRNNSIVNADVLAEAAFKALKLSTGAVLPIAREYFQPPLMDSWIDNEVSKG